MSGGGRSPTTAAASHHTLEIEIPVGCPMKSDPDAQARGAPTEHAGHLTMLEHPTLGRVLRALQRGRDAAARLNRAFQRRRRRGCVVGR
jgi:hypothetical protein